jgi:hypothetical protein
MDMHKEEINEKKEIILHFIENEVLSCLGIFCISYWFRKRHLKLRIEIACMAWHNEMKKGMHEGINRSEVWSIAIIINWIVSKFKRFLIIHLIKYKEGVFLLAYMLYALFIHSIYSIRFSLYWFSWIFIMKDLNNNNKDYFTQKDMPIIISLCSHSI